jgi:branched-chain amino acid transport system substrate-binding protein
MHRSFAIIGSLVGLLGATAAGAQTKTVKIGVLNDQSSVYADTGGPGSTLAAQMAVEDSGLVQKGWKIDVIAADHQNKPDVGSSIARQWYDVDKVDMIIDLPNSGVALAVNQVTKEKNKVVIVSGSGTTDLTGKACSPNTVHWTYDTYMLAKGTGTAMTKAGGNTWFFVTVDNALGVALEKDTTAAVIATGGKSLGSVRHPLNNADFSSFLLQAQASGAKVVGLANAGNDATGAIKQAHEFGLTGRGQKLAALLIVISDVHGLGLDAAQGLTLTESFYWDMNEQTRGFSDRFAKRAKNGAKPTMDHAGVYAGVLHYLKAAEALGDTSDGAKLVAKMKELPTYDPLFGKGSIRADGRKIHPAYLFEVKTPAESKAPWDYYKLMTTIPADEAFRPLAESECPLVTK